MSDADAIALLRAVADDEGASIAKIAKRTGLDQSRLHRLLSALGDDPNVGGLDLVAVHHDGARRRLFLTERGRALVWSGS